MTNKKITDLAVVSTLDGTELLPAVQGGVTKKVDVASLRGSELAYAENISAVVQTIAVQSFTAITGCSITLPPQTKAVWLEALCMVQLTVAPASGSSVGLQALIFDELDNVLGAFMAARAGGAGTGGGSSLEVRCRVPASPIAKTYRLQTSAVGAAATYAVLNGAVGASGGTVTPAYRSSIAAFRA